MVVFKMMLAASLKDKITLFYSLLLPLGLLAGLGLYFDDPAYAPRLLTGVIVLSSMFWGVSGIAFQVHWQRSRGVFKLLKLTPYPMIGFIAQMTAARSFLGILINLFVLAVGMLLFRIELSAGEFFFTVCFMVAGALCFGSLGYLISNFAGNEGQINLISNLLFIPMVFGSEAFYSLDHAPDWVVKMGETLPLVHFVQGMHIAQGLSAEPIVLPLLILVLYTMLLMIAAALTFKYDTAG